MPNSVSRSVLIVDADTRTREAIAATLTEAGYAVRVAATGDETRRILDEDATVELLLVDERVANAFDLIRSSREQAPGCAVIALLGETSLDRAVQALKDGADDCLFRPVEPDELLDRARIALQGSAQHRSPIAPGSPALVGNAPQLDSIRQLIRTVAETPVSCVLLTGESGTGKGLVARAIHAAGPRAAGPFVNITCTALPESLLESELFGHEPGSFTGATRLKRGLFELSDGGTLFLDEIGDMSPSLQAKLLRFTEERALRRVGGTRDINVDVRLIAATHKDLSEAVADGSFREDLFYRLQVVHLEIPPLRNRNGDIGLLARHFVDQFSHEFGKPVAGLEPAALELLYSHSWPGNVRELKHVIERAVLMCKGERLATNDLCILNRRSRVAFRLPPGGLVLEELERDLLVQALEQTGWNATRAGRLLGLNRDQVRYRIEKFGIATPSSRTGDSQMEVG